MGSEMCIRDRNKAGLVDYRTKSGGSGVGRLFGAHANNVLCQFKTVIPFSSGNFGSRKISPKIFIEK